MTSQWPDGRERRFSPLESTGVNNEEEEEEEEGVIMTRGLLLGGIAPSWLVSRKSAGWAWLFDINFFHCVQLICACF